MWMPVLLLRPLPAWEDTVKDSLVFNAGRGGTLAGLHALPELDELEFWAPRLHAYFGHYSAAQISS